MAVFVPLVLIFLAVPVTAVDLTITEKATGTDVIEAVVDVIHQSCIFSDDRLMLRRIAAVETDDGRHERTFKRNGVDFYGGIWQVDDQSFEATRSSVHTTIHAKINASFGINWPAVKYNELWKPLYSGLAARLKVHSDYGSSSMPQDVLTQAQYWVRSFTINSWGSETNAVDLYKEASNRTATRCGSPKADVIFVLDSSGSITSPVFVSVRQFVVDVVRLFVIGSNNVRVSVVQFSSTAQTEFNLTKYDTTDQIVNATYKIPYMNGGTNTAAGLRELESVVKGEGRQDQGVPVIAILMTDGQSGNPTETITEADRIHRELGDKMVVYSIGVGSGVVVRELDAIASKPTCLYVFQLASFNDITAFSYQIMKAACKVPAQLPEGKPVSGVVQRGESYYFKAGGKKDKRGIAVTVNTPIGSSVTLYVSWTIQNPSRALYDYNVDVDSSSINGGVRLTVPWPEKVQLTADSRNVNDTAGEATTMTLYGTVEGTGAHVTGNSFELVYAISDWSDSAASSTAVNLTTLLLSLLAILLLLR